MKLQVVVQDIREYISAILALAFVAIFLAIVCKGILEPLGPGITLLTVCFCTSLAVKKGNTLLSFSGLFLYGLSWPTSYTYGQLLGSSVCALGIFVWFWSFIGSAKK